MIASAVLFDADRALRTVLGIGADVVSRLTVVRALCQPLFDRHAVSGRVVVIAAAETEASFTHLARRLLRAGVVAPQNRLAVGAGTETELRMGFDVVLERELLILVAKLRP